MGFLKVTPLSCIEAAGLFTSGLDTLSCNCTQVAVAPVVADDRLTHECFAGIHDFRFGACGL